MKRELKEFNFREMLPNGVCIYDVELSFQINGSGDTGSKFGHVFAALDDEGNPKVNSYFFEKQKPEYQEEMKSAIGRDVQLFFGMKNNK